MGKVYLVGAGPGDPELLTVKAVGVLAKAEVVLHDALVSAEVLGLAAKSAKLIDIGKRCGQKLLTQEEINALLVQSAKKVTTTVRLKGGDPSVFGRGGEEIAALTEAGVEFEIIPGITTALAAAALAKISLTDRRFASSLTLMTAHRSPGNEVEWDRLVTSGSTLAIYMPGKDYATLSASLSKAGLAGETPCVVVSQVSSRREQRLFTTVSGLSQREALPAPAIVIVGDCASALERVKAAQLFTEQSLGSFTSLQKEIA